MARSPFFTFASPLAAFALIAACSASGTGSEDDGLGGSGGAAASGGAAGNGATAGSGGSSGNGGSGAGTSQDSGLLIDVASPDDSGQLQDGDVCAGSFSQAKPTPLNVMVMFDQSSSMKGSRWTTVVQALKDFTVAPEAAGIFMALNYFALTRPCQTNGDCQSNWGKCGDTKFCTFDDYCSPADYETPEIEFAELPGAAASIAASLDAHGPEFNTPTPPALQGAINHAKAWASSHPDEKVVVLLMTDGQPDSITCNIGNGAMPNVVSIARAGAQGSPAIPTYVIGVGNKVGDLNSVAAAGGTTKAYMVDGAGGSATRQQLLQALNGIRGSALPCSYGIPQPQSGTLDYGKVNVVFTPGGGQPTTIGQVRSAGDCGASGGWYYDDPTRPTTIQICPTTCQSFRGSAGGSVELQLGCDTVIQIQ